jgi:hypothetical protein
MIHSGLPKSRSIIVVMTFMLLGLSANAFSQSDLLIFGDAGHDQFLGCIICNESSAQSICNGIGTYGNEFSTKGMFNEFSEFGNEFSSSSPWNEFSTSTSVPVVVDRDGNFYGYFTINDMRSDAFEFSDTLKHMYEYAEGNLEKVRRMLCNSLGYEQ